MHPLRDKLLQLRDSLLDPTIVLSFDRSGFARHAQRFDPGDLDVDLKGRTIAVTGANSGLGLAASTALARLGARVVMLCRDPGRGERARREVAADPLVRAAGGSAELVRCDVSDLDDVDRAVAALRGADVDALIHNAGALLPERRLTAGGLELTLATHVVGPYRMTAKLWPHMRRAPGAPARIVWVSSGGMYPRRLEVDRLARVDGPFDGVEAYADAKRAQVVLSEELALRLRGASVTSNAMHPGWASTVGVRTALPRFHRLTRSILRTAEQGADTAVWLAASRRVADATGGFWFDRREVSPYLVPGTREPGSERSRLVTALDSWAELGPGAFELPSTGG